MLEAKFCFYLNYISNKQRYKKICPKECHPWESRSNCSDCVENNKTLKRLTTKEESDKLTAKGEHENVDSEPNHYCDGEEVQINLGEERGDEIGHGRILLKDR